tara:strand:+ start:90 stop:317 length:228 start_codon:yes stop_codon:yes gene_type:complete
MKKLFRNFALILCSLGLAMVLQSCEEQGPAEKAGEKVDSAIEQTQEKLEEAGEKMEEAVEEGGEKIEEAGEKMQQ